MESLPPLLPEVLPLPKDEEEEWTISAVLPSSDDLRLLASIRDSSSVENKELVDASRLRRMVSKLLELLEWRSSVFIFTVGLVVVVFTNQQLNQQSRSQGILDLMGIVTISDEQYTSFFRNAVSFILYQNKHLNSMGKIYDFYLTKVIKMSVA